VKHTHQVISIVQDTSQEEDVQKQMAQIFSLWSICLEVCPDAVQQGLYELARCGGTLYER